MNDAWPRACSAATLAVFVLALAALPGGAMSADASAPAAPATTMAPAPATHAPADAHPDVVVEDDRLTLHVVDTPLQEVLGRIASSAGARLEGTARDSSPVTLDLDAVPLAQGISRLLGNQNFLLAYRADGRLSRLALLGAPQDASGAQIVAAAPPPPPTGPPAAPGGPLLDRTITLQPGTPIANLLQRQRVTLRELLDVALRNPDAELRTDAVRTGAKAFDEQPELTGLATGMLHNMDDAALEAAVRSLAGDNAYDLVSQIAVTLRSPDMRLRGLKLMQRLAPGH